MNFPHYISFSLCKLQITHLRTFLQVNLVTYIIVLLLSWCSPLTALFLASCYIINISYTCAVGAVMLSCTCWVWSFHCMKWGQFFYSGRTCKGISSTFVKLLYNKHSGVQNIVFCTHPKMVWCTIYDNEPVEVVISISILISPCSLFRIT